MRVGDLVVVRPDGGEPNEGLLVGDVCLIEEEHASLVASSSATFFIIRQLRTGQINKGFRISTRFDPLEAADDHP